MSFSSVLSLSVSPCLSLSLLSVPFCLAGFLSLLPSLSLLSLFYPVFYSVFLSLVSHFFILVGKPAHTCLPPRPPPHMQTHTAFDLCSLPYTLLSRLPQLLTSIWYEFLLRQETPPPRGGGWGKDFSRRTCGGSGESGLGSGPGLPVRSQEPGGVQGAQEREGEQSPGCLPSSSLLRPLLPPFPQMLEMPSLPQKPGTPGCRMETPAPRHVQSCLWC